MDLQGAELVANASGEVDTASQAPVKGSRHIRFGDGTHLVDATAESKVERYQPPRQLGPQMVNFELVSAKQTIATAQLEQLAVGDGVRRTEVNGDIQGYIVYSSGGRPHPAVLVVGGSEGWHTTTDKAARGWRRTALCGPGAGLFPSARIALRCWKTYRLKIYFGKAIAWMIQRQDVLPERARRPGHLARRRAGSSTLGSLYSTIHAVVAYVPANVRYARMLRPKLRL